MKLILLKLLTPPSDIKMTFLILIILIGWIYPTEHYLNIANYFYTEASFLNLSITNGIVSSKVYDTQDDFDFEIVYFPFLDEDDPTSPSSGLYISQLTRLAIVCSNVDDSGVDEHQKLFLLLRYLNKVRDTIKFEKHFLNSTSDTQS